MPFPREQTKMLGELRGWRCDKCGRAWKDGWLMEGHHILPTSLGGTNSSSNFQLLCLDCHLKAHAAIAVTQNKSARCVAARLRATGGRWKK